MFKTFILSAFIAASGSHLYAESGKPIDLSILPPDVAARVVQLQGYGDRYEKAIDAILAEWTRPDFSNRAHEVDLTILAPEVANNVLELQEHGDRFDGAIRAIFIEAVKPAWGFDDCGHDEGLGIPHS